MVEPGGGREGHELSRIVRPYAWTRGKTRSNRHLAIESQVQTSDLGADFQRLEVAEHRAIAQLCLAPQSVAEVAALLGLPLEIARVLLGDMADVGLVDVAETAAKPSRSNGNGTIANWAYGSAGGDMDPRDLASTELVTSELSDSDLADFVDAEPDVDVMERVLIGLRRL